jgi:hypothetical protein
VAPGGTCQYFFTFTPTQAGQATATSFSTTNGGDIVVNLRGTGVGSTATYSPLVIDFGPVVPGTTSTQQAVTIINTGLATLANFAGGAPGVPFNATQNCAGGVAPGASCQFFFTFTPLESGRYHKDSIVSTNAGNIVIELWGGEPLKLCLPVVIR